MAMFLNGSFFGMSFISGANPMQSPITLSNIVLTGSQNVRFTQVFNRKLTREEKLAFDYTNPVFGVNTVMLARYNNNLNAGNVLSDESVISWDVQRLNTRTNILEFLGNVPVEQTEFIDYTAVRGQEYIYEVFGRTANTITDGASSDAITPNFFGWYLIDTVTQEVMLFDIDISSGTLTNVRDVTEHQTFAQYPTMAFGRRNYYSGQITAYGGERDGNNIVFDSAYQERVKRFINNDNVKLMKDRKGILYRVQTYGVDIQYYDDIGEQPFNVSWHFTEVGEAGARLIN